MEELCEIHHLQPVVGDATRAQRYVSLLDVKGGGKKRNLLLYMRYCYQVSNKDEKINVVDIKGHIRRKDVQNSVLVITAFVCPLRCI